MPPPRRRWLLALALVVASLALAACGASSGAGSGNAGSTPSSAPPGAGAGGAATGMPPAAPGSGPTPQPLPEPPGFTPPTQTVMDPVAGQRERRVPWRLVRAEGSALVVEVVSGGPPCDAVTGVEAAETATSVTVTAWTGRVPGATGCEGPQPAIAGIFWVRVPLAAPLGSRTPTQGPVG